MDATFIQHLESLHQSLERLIAMQPVTIATLPSDAPSQCIYLLSDGGRHLYVGRTRRQTLRKRLRQHSSKSARHYEAVFAFKIAREETGRIQPGYTAKNSRAVLAADPVFAQAFAQAKHRIRQMELRWVDESDPLQQTLLEIYVAVVLKTPYNDFDTH